MMRPPPHVKPQERKNRRKRLIKVIARTDLPNKLPKFILVALFMRLRDLLAQLPANGWGSLGILAYHGRVLNKWAALVHTKQNNQANKGKVNVYSYLKDKNLMTDCAVAAAICVPTNKFATTDEYEKYCRYQVVIILSCLKLHIIGIHDSAIQNALREIRLISTDSEHLPLLALLPDLPKDVLHNLGALTSALDKLRNQNNPSSALLQRGLSFLYIAINNACKWSEGITRTRKRKHDRDRDRDRSVTFTPSQPEKLKLTRQAPTDDTDLTVSELTISRIHTNAELDEVDENLDIRSGKVINIKEPSSPHKAMELRVRQSKRLAEQLSIRQLSLSCSFEQASEWDIQHLVVEAVGLLSDGSNQESAAILLLSLLSGRSPEQLTSNNATKLMQEFKQHPCLCLTHSVPASKQSPDCNTLLPSVHERLISPLPAALKGQKITCSSLDTDKLNAIISGINDRHQTRLTLGRISRFLEHWYLNQGLDRAEIALIRGELPKSRPALSYSSLDADLIIEHHRDYIDAVFRMAEIDPGLPTLHLTNNRLGSRLVLPKHVLHNLFDFLSPPPAIKISNSLDGIITYHNRYVAYVCALLTFVTGHRDVTAPMGQLSDYNPYTQTWWISDKEVRHGLAARTVVLPITAARQVELYLQHLRALEQRTRFVAPKISERCETALAGSANLLFAISTPFEMEAAPADLCPSLLRSLYGKKLPFPRNWPRHHLRSELKQLGVAPEQIDGWMGHEEIGEEALGRHSGLSRRFLDQIANQIEQIMNYHQIKALPGWQTH